MRTSAAVSAEGDRREVQYFIDDVEHRLDVVGSTKVGGPEVLLEMDDDLSRGRPWAEQGYTVAPFLSEEHWQTLRAGVTRRLRDFCARVKSVPPVESFDLSHYHHYIQTGDEHKAVIASLWAEFCGGDGFPIDPRIIDGRVSELLATPVSSFCPTHREVRYFVRIVRPNAQDYNPPHRDVWLKRLRNGMNIYVPFAGSSHLSSLPIVAGSHRWPESAIERTSRGATVQGVPYTVPSVVGIEGGIRMIRPNPSENEALLFSPYLVHGGAANDEPNRTRMSLEMRFWRTGAT